MGVRYDEHKCQNHPNLKFLVSRPSSTLVSVIILTDNHEKSNHALSLTFKEQIGIVDEHRNLPHKTNAVFLVWDMVVFNAFQ